MSMRDVFEATTSWILRAVGVHEYQVGLWRDLALGIPVAVALALSQRPFVLYLDGQNIDVPDVAMAVAMALVGVALSTLSRNWLTLLGVAMVFIGFRYALVAVLASSPIAGCLAVICVIGGRRIAKSGGEPPDWPMPGRPPWPGADTRLAWLARIVVAVGFLALSVFAAEAVLVAAGVLHSFQPDMLPVAPLGLFIVARLLSSAAGLRQFTRWAFVGGAIWLAMFLGLGVYLSSRQS